MKKSKHALLLTIIAVILSACGSSRSLKDRLLAINQGMSKEQVISALGKPDFRRFADNREEWEYNKGGIISNFLSVVIVVFEDGKVSSLDSFSEYLPVQQPQPQTPAAAPGVILPSREWAKRVMNDVDFNSLYKLAKDKPFKDNRYEIIRDAAANNAFTCKQIKSLMGLFSFDDDKVMVIELTSTNIYDRQNISILIDALDFSTSKEKARKMLLERR
jgi:hypothetical protein